MGITRNKILFLSMGFGVSKVDVNESQTIGFSKIGLLECNKKVHRFCS
jgi:hypothetical protein